MTPRFARLCSAGLLLLSIAPTQAQTPGGPLPEAPRAQPAPQPLPAAPSSMLSRPAAAPETAATTSGLIPSLRPGTPDDIIPVFNLPEADIDTVLGALELYTGKTIFHPAQLQTPPNGYTLHIKEPTRRSTLVLYIETILTMNGIAVIPLGNDALKIVQLQNSPREAPELITGSTLDLPPSSKVASKLYQLEFLRVQEFQQMITGMVNLAFGTPIPIANANSIVITDTVSNLQRFEALMKQVDRPALGGMATKFYQLRNGAKASDLVNKLSAILRTLQPQLGSGTNYNADDRTNQIILITDPRQFPFFDELIAKLDVRADPNTRNEVIPLKHAKAADLASVLLTIVKGQTQTAQRSQSARPVTNQLQPPANTPTPLGPPTAQPPPQVVGGAASNAGEQGSGQEFSGLLTIGSDERSNSIVVSGTLDDIRLVQELIDKLDIVLAQVRIEVVIAEVTLDDNHDSGISQLGLQLQGDKLTGFSSSGPSFSIAGNAGSGLATITRPGGDVAVSGAWDLAGLISLNTTKRKNNTTILTVPAIVTSHGKKSMITDGETRPVITGTTTYANGASSGASSSQITQQPIGTTLTVTPYIGNDGSVQLDIEQELTDVVDNVTVDGNQQYVIGNRKANSYVTAMSGEIHVLGGFRKQIDSKQTNRLGPIPIIGDLLGRRTRDKYRQELIFFIRPVVLTNNASVDNVETLNRLETLPTRDEIKGQLDPKFQPPKKPVLDRILPK